jgi:hypothetical protein
MHKWMEQDDKSHGWQHISRIRLEQDHAHRRQRLRGVAQQPAGPIAGVGSDAVAFPAPSVPAVVNWPICFADGAGTSKCGGDISVPSRLKEMRIFS